MLVTCSETRVEACLNEKYLGTILLAVYKKRLKPKVKMSNSCQILFWFRDLLKSTKQTINFNILQHQTLADLVTTDRTIAFIKKTRGTILTPVTTTYSPISVVNIR